MELSLAWPRVTVFTLVYNTGEFVIKALESVKANNYPNLQHIIVDDASFDGKSVEIVQDWITHNNYPCTFLKHPENRGICATLNEILRLTDGKYTFGVSDDLIAHDRIVRQVEILESNSEEYGLVYGDCYLINDAGELLPETFYQRQKVDVQGLPSGYCYDEILTNYFLCTPSIMAKTRCYVDVGGYDESLYLEDIDIFTRILKNYKVLKTAYIGTFYRVHSNSLSSLRNFKFYDSVIRVYERNLGISPKTDLILHKKLFEYSELYFAANGPNAASVFLHQLKRQFTAKAFFFFLLALTGVKHLTFSKLFSKVQQKS